VDSSAPVTKGSTAKPGWLRRAGLVPRVWLSCVLLAMLQPVVAADPEVASDWTLATSDGSSIHLSEVASKQTTVLFFWATWCPYCKALMPHLQSIRLEYGDDVAIIAINIFEDGDPVEFLRSAGYDFTLLLNGEEVAEAYGINGTPGVLVIRADRSIAFDLRRVRPIALSVTERPVSNTRKAAYMAPYWAAEIRKGIDLVLAGGAR